VIQKSDTPVLIVL